MSLLQNSSQLEICNFKIVFGLKILCLVFKLYRERRILHSEVNTLQLLVSRLEQPEHHTCKDRKEKTIACHIEQPQFLKHTHHLECRGKVCRGACYYALIEPLRFNCRKHALLNIYLLRRC